jgi:hypothetical protein
VRFEAEAYGICNVSTQSIGNLATWTKTLRLGRREVSRYTRRMKHEGGKIGKSSRKGGEECE